MKKIIIALCVVLAVFAVGYNAYQSEKQATTGKKKVYAVLPLSGPFASYGKDLQKIMDIYMAQRQFDFEMKYVDSEGNPSKAVTSLQQATVNDKNPIVISAFSYISTVLAPVVHDKNGFLFGVISVSIASDTNSWQRISGSAKDTIKPMINYIKQNPKKTDVICIQDEYSLSELKAIKEEGVAINKELFLDMNILDVRNSVLKLLSDHPERVVVLGQPCAAYMNIIRELKAQEYKGEVFTDSGLSNPPIIKALGDNAEGIYTSTMTIEADIPLPEKIQKMSEQLAQKGVPIYICVSEAVDTLDLIQYTLENKLPLSQETYAKMKKWDGLAGTTYFPGNGAANVDFYILTQRKDHKFLPVQDEKDE